MADTSFTTPDGDAKLFNDDDSIFSKITKAYQANYKTILPASKIMGDNK